MRQYLKAGLLDEMQIHLIPVLLGGGVRLFEDLDPAGIELRRTSSIETPSATHFRFEMVKRHTYSPMLHFVRRGRREDDRLGIEPPGVVNDDDGRDVPAGRVASPQGQVANSL